MTSEIGITGFGLAEIKREGYVFDGNGISTPGHAMESWAHSRQLLLTLPWYLQYLGGDIIKLLLERMWTRALLHAESERRQEGRQNARRARARDLGRDRVS